MDRPIPTDGKQLERPVVRCSGCRAHTQCYRGPVVKVEKTEHGELPVHAWLCPRCMAEAVGAALRED